jgi:hypothetical protein
MLMLLLRFLSRQDTENSAMENQTLVVPKGNGKYMMDTRFEVIMGVNVKTEILKADVLYTSKTPITFYQTPRPY